MLKYLWERNRKFLEHTLSFYAKDECKAFLFTFAKAIKIATQIKDAVKYAKDTIGHSNEHVTEVQNVNKKIFKPKFKNKIDFPSGACGRRGNFHEECRYKNATCAICKK